MRMRSTFMSLLFASALPLAAQAGQWQSYQAPEYGFSMLVPQGAQLKTQEWPGGWGGLVGQYQGIVIWGVAKLGAQEPPGAIEAFGVQLTGIPAEAWGEFAEGADKGWQGYKAVSAQVGDKIVVGGYGIGPKGSYLVLLQTTEADFEAHADDYEAWYESAQLN